MAKCVTLLVFSQSSPLSQKSMVIALVQHIYTAHFVKGCLHFQHFWGKEEKNDNSPVKEWSMLVLL